MDKKMRQKNNGNGSLSPQSSSRLQKSDGGRELRPAKENGIRETEKKVLQPVCRKELTP